MSMTIRVKFYDMGGHELTTRQFQPMQRVDINIYVVGGILTRPIAFANAACDVVVGASSIFSQQSTTNLFGVADFQMQFPANVSGHGNVHIVVNDPLLATGNVDVPIAFGDTSPNPAPEEDTTDWFTKATNNIVLLAVVGVGVYFVVKWKRRK